MATANVPTNSTSEQPRRKPAGGPISGHQHRRHLLGVLAAAPVAAALPAMAIDAEDPHLGWEAQAEELRRRSRAVTDEEAGNDLWAAAWDIDQRIVDTPAASMPALAAQLRVAARRIETGNAPTDGAMMATILAGAERLARRA